MNATPHVVSKENVRELNRDSVRDPNEIAALLQRIVREGVPLRCGFTTRGQEEVAVVTQVLPEQLVLQIEHFEVRQRHQVFFRFHVDGTDFFFASPILDATDLPHLVIRRPESLALSERRDLHREQPVNARPGVHRVELLPEIGDAVPAKLAGAVCDVVCVNVRLQFVVAFDTFVVQFAPNKQFTTVSPIIEVCLYRFGSLILLGLWVKS